MHHTCRRRVAALVLGVSASGAVASALTGPAGAAPAQPDPIRPGPVVEALADALTVTDTADPAVQVVDPARWQTVANIAADSVRAARDQDALTGTVAALQSLAGCAGQWRAAAAPGASLLAACGPELSGLGRILGPRLLAALVDDHDVPPPPRAPAPRTPAPDNETVPNRGNNPTGTPTRPPEVATAEPGVPEAPEQHDGTHSEPTGVPARPEGAGAAATTGPGRFVAPTAGVITSTFGDARGHGGIDIANTMGAPIVAVADGEVISAGPAQGYGLWVRIRHDDGTVTTYGHNNTNLVTMGQRVKAGQKIATVGDRGNSTGPHLHFEVEDPTGVKADPVQWLAQRGASVVGVD
ncbi:M23 family metallopeptidase [Rhodococcus ruber]|uniref:M23 family metallopeptidase n=1 Tax=Rhodococcus ruber TaxID=1830 RepID=UPI00265AF7B0|nr:M23 family metallopeptidase [Rhodococcus ruber]WKK11189.1 M23 family metallopeptidase [Rhodococcus ruber]